MSKIAETKSIEWQKANHPMAIGGDSFADIVDMYNINPAFVAGYDQSAKDTIARVSAEVEKIKNRLCADITLSGMNEKHYALPYIQRIAHFLSELEKEYSNE